MITDLMRRGTRELVGTAIYNRSARDTLARGGSALDNLSHALSATNTLVPEMLNNPARVQSAYTDALWADSTGARGSRFSQLEQRLIDEGKDSAAQRGLYRVLGSTAGKRNTDISRGIAQRQIRSFGTSMTGEESAAMDRRFGLERVLNRVDAQAAADRAADARRTLIRDYSFEAEGERQNISGGALATASGSQVEREGGDAASRAQKRANRNAQIGQAVGMIAMLAASHSSFKDNVTAIGDGEILEGLRQLDVNRWQYKGDGVRHLGPMAEDFQRVFGVGDGVTLHAADVMGVLIGAIRELAIAAKRD